MSKHYKGQGKPWFAGGCSRDQCRARRVLGYTRNLRSELRQGKDTGRPGLKSGITEITDKEKGSR